MQQSQAIPERFRLAADGVTVTCPRLPLITTHDGTKIGGSKTLFTFDPCVPQEIRTDLVGLLNALLPQRDDPKAHHSAAGQAIMGFGA